ncbi:MAG: tetratricopeptide repeat protein [Xanthomonadales bacterium]|nr:tetratricopeptide repeat protein [Xanthomonadales bacterium]
MINSPLTLVKLTRTLVRRSLSALLIGLLCALITTTTVAQSSAKKEQKTKVTVAMSQEVYDRLEEIQALVEAEDINGALAKIRSLQEKKKLSPYEKAQIWNVTAYAYYVQENYKQAISAYESLLALADLPEALQQSALKTMAQLYFTTEDYNKTLATIKRFRAVVPSPAADVYNLEGSAYYQMEDFKKAIPPLKKAIDMYMDQGRTPKESWLLLLRFCYYELKDYPNMLKTLEQLIESYPKDTYVLNLAGVYSELGDTKKQLVLTESLFEKGYIEKKKHAVNLANLYLMHELPIKAAQLLETEMKANNVDESVRNLRLLSQAWYSAREDKKAIPPLKRAAAVGNDGELYIRLAQSYINLEQWNNAADSAKKGLEIGGVKRKDTANIMYGMALFNQKKLEQSKRAFQAAGKDKRSKRAAGQWIKYVDSEIRRRDTLEQKLPEMKAREIDDILKANQAPSE